MRVERLEELRVWKHAIHLAKEVYTVSGTIKDFGYRDQLQRAVVSISNNIAEGFGRQSPKEFRRFLFYARGSSQEVKSMLHLGRALGYYSEKTYKKLLSEQEKINKMIWGLISYLSRSN